MIHKHLPLWNFDSFSSFKNLRHFVSMREGGVSQGELSSLNLSYSTGDKPENVVENRRRLAEAVGIDQKALIFGRQVHGSAVKYVSREIAYNEAVRQEFLKETDALFTDVKGVCLCVMAADCVPLLFYVPRQQVIGVAHAGWRGTVAKIGQKTALAIMEKFKCNPDELFVGIAPSISAAVYEVGSDVIEAVEKAFGTTKELILNERNGKGFFDLWKANVLQLTEVGIPLSHI
ncbi:MAG: peptidoglycan editing factor PgeF, partial [Flammeovirgaceae bacterium]|nr:peptidoglycan editing factor PgeF [Flammeovirgaceae bacterium]